MIFTLDNCREMNPKETYENKLVIIKEEYFKKECRNAENQLFLALGGFGCDPSKMGRAVFGRFFDGETCRVNRENILGIASEEAIQTWEKVYGRSRDCFKKESKKN